MVNTPRDYYVVLPGANMRDKLTHAGAYGIRKSIATLEALYGVGIDYYAKINFTGFTNVIDALGGVDVNSEYEFLTIKRESIIWMARLRYGLQGNASRCLIRILRVGKIKWQLLMQ